MEKPKHRLGFALKKVRLHCVDVMYDGSVRIWIAANADMSAGTFIEVREQAVNEITLFEDGTERERKLSGD